MSHSDDLQIAEELSRRVAEKGGRVYYVGGYVRDLLMGRENKDIDVEAHGISYASLLSVLETLGTPLINGVSFGVFGLKGSHLDIALPRREKLTGRGHRDFEVFVDPLIGPEEAAGRRDFTINAMLQDVLTGEILDFYGGRSDLQKGVIRHVRDTSFPEDPLRVLRAAQFSARFGFSIADETVRLCSGMDLSALSRERIMEELKKAMLTAPTPSVFFGQLRSMDQLDFWFPEVKALIGVGQDPSFHPEGDVWTHTMMVLNEAAKLRSEAKQPLPYMLSALCHDFGKPYTTEFINGKIHSYHHETEGLKPASDFVERLTAERSLKKYVLNMVEMHMRPNLLISRKSGEKAYMKTFDLSCEPEDLLLLAKADFLGCGLGKSDYSGHERILREKYRQYRERMSLPYVTGNDLILAGVEPGTDFSEALGFAHKCRLAGVPKEDSLKQTLGYIRSMRRKRRDS
ncbi:MAG: tRNA nucleotidyltransferase [Clostridia bacterium]|nr:tRNA nucleotidyltransferase [Clostridia bacterium]